MSKTATIAKFRSLESLARKLRRDLKGVSKRKKTANRKGLYAVSCGTQRSHFFMAGANG